MIALLLIATIADGWSYADAIEHPKPKPAGVGNAWIYPANPEPPPAPDLKLPPLLPSAPPPAKPQRWRLADSTGQAWEFHDREKLIDWVKARNGLTTTQVPPATFQAPQYFGGASCASGQCYGR